jgi:hypothetical protein
VFILKEVMEIKPGDVVKIKGVGIIGIVHEIKTTEKGIYCYYKDNDGVLINIYIHQDCVIKL